MSDVTVAAPERPGIIDRILPGRKRGRIVAGTIVAATLYATVAAGFRWLDERLQVVPPAVQPRDVYPALFDLKPITVTVTAGTERTAWHTTVHDLRTDWTLWRRMHLADWNTVPADLRHEALDNMLARYRRILLNPAAWDQMQATRLGSGAAADSHRRLSGDGGVLDGLLPRWREVRTAATTSCRYPRGHRDV